MEEKMRLTKAETTYVREHIRVSLRDDFPKGYRALKDDHNLRRWMEYFFLDMFQTLKIRWGKDDQLDHGDYLNSRDL